MRTNEELKFLDKGKYDYLLEEEEMLKLKEEMELVIKNQRSLNKNSLERLEVLDRVEFLIKTDSSIEELLNSMQTYKDTLKMNIAYTEKYEYGRGLKEMNTQLIYCRIMINTILKKSMREELS